MTQIWQITKKGLENGLHVMWTLMKIVVPVYIGVQLLNVSSLLGIIAEWLAPVLHIIGLPGEAALPLILGGAINIYSALGGIAALSLSAKQLTIIGGFILVAHSLVMEAAIIKKAGSKPYLLVVFRIVLAFLVAFSLNSILK